MGGLRETLEAAVQEHSEEPVPGSEVVPDAGTGVANDNDEAPTLAGAEAANTDAEPVEAKPMPEGRDEKGRFAPKSKADEASTQVVSGPAPVVAAPVVKPGARDGVTPSQQAEAVRPPQSWRADVREEWAKLPPAVQSEVQRREAEITKALGETARERDLAAQFREVANPYEAMFRGAGISPLQAFDSYARTEMALQGPQKNAVLAHLIRTYGGSPEQIGQLLQGQPANDNRQAQQNFDPAHLVREVEQRVAQRFQQQQAQAEQQKLVGEWQAFGQDPANEFFGDVSKRMAVLYDAAAQSGEPISFKEAYDQACTLDKKVSGALKQRELAAQANAKSASTQQAKAAASSVRSQPAPSSGAQAKDLRSALMAAVKVHTKE